MAAGKLISRDELLGGFRGGDKRRAAIALSLIEARAARIAIARGSVNAPYMTEGAFKERNHAFLGAIAEGTKDAVKISIQNLERSAPDWQVLVPENPEIRAEIARLIGEAYRFSRPRVPQMAAALGLDDPAVLAAFQAHHGHPLATIYEERTAPLEALRWTWMRVSTSLESLPPFWTAFALTLTEIIGVGTLALPVAFATIGPLAGAILLISVGLVNLLTVGYLAEASARNSSILYGSAFIGQLAHDFLSPFAVVVVRLTLFCFCCIVLVAFYTGFATTLGSVTGLPDQIWVTLIMAFGVFLVLRKSLIGTVASALLIGFLNIAILVVLSIAALTQASWERLTAIKVPFLYGEPFDTSLLQLVFGIVMACYFGHVSVSNCAQAVLRREADGRSLKSGTMAAMVVAIGIYMFWSVSIGAAIDPERLISEKGTVLVPLAEQVGPGVLVLGTIFALLAMGMGAVHFCLGIFNMVREVFSGGHLPLPLIKSIDSTRAKGWPTLIALVPIFLIFGYVQWSFFAERQSFIKPLELLGVLLTPILAGVLPVLLLIASRRRGRAIGRAKLPAILSNQILIGAIGLLAFAGLVLHGLVIWDDPFKQGAALAAAAVMLAIVIDPIRKGAFSPQWLIEIRVYPEEAHRAEIAVAYRGNSVDTEVTCQWADGTETRHRPGSPLADFGACRCLIFDLPDKPASGLQISAHRVSSGFEAEAITGEVNYLMGGTGQHSIALGSKTGQKIMALPKGPLRLQLCLP